MLSESLNKTFLSLSLSLLVQLEISGVPGLGVVEDLNHFWISFVESLQSSALHTDRSRGNDREIVLEPQHHDGQAGHYVVFNTSLVCLATVDTTKCCRCTHDQA